MYNIPGDKIRLKCIRIIIYTVILTCLFLNPDKGYTQDKTIEDSGNALLFSLPVVALGSTFIIGDKKGSWQFLKGFVVNEIVTYGLKSAIHKPRPNGANNRSFPSGHTSTTFQSAAFIQKRYGWRYGLPAYALAVWTGYSRIQADQHDLLDVLVGAVIGIGSSYVFTSEYPGKHLELTFSSSGKEVLIGFRCRFK
ncbi:phosphatase PAP2 family protein [Sinomicrobium sp. M5D2P17]